MAPFPFPISHSLLKCGVVVVSLLECEVSNDRIIAMRGSSGLEMRVSNGLIIEMQGGSGLIIEMRGV